MEQENKEESQHGPLLEYYNKEQSETLCAELRERLVTAVAETGGHLSSNLGTVELTVAVHRVFDTSKDRLVFDVGHQCYVHKMLTGREEAMKMLRKYGGMAGFPKPSESVHDAFVAGHASNSVAVAVGMAQGRNLLQEDYKVMALIGDGALTGGLAYEGLATGGGLSGQLLVILNDNGMSIAKSVGGIARYLGGQRVKPQYLALRKIYRKLLGGSALGRKIHKSNHRIKQAIKGSLFPSSFFEQLGFTYYGPVDGHDVEALTKMLRYAKDQTSPVLLHVRTVKGKGYAAAEKSPDAFHGVAPFDVKTGVLPKSSAENFSAVFGATLTALAEKNPKICGITAAMPTGTGLHLFGEKFPERLLDVGIAEGCATSIMGGLAKQGAIPVFAVYSTFLQRAYDMLLHDIALEKLHCIIAVDRGGLVGEDGETHHGVFDVAFLSTVPSLMLLAPSCFLELKEMLTWATEKGDCPIGIRYPRGGEGGFSCGFSGESVDLLEEGKNITLVSYGTNINDVIACGKLLKVKGFAPEILKVNRLSPLDLRKVSASVEKTGRLLVVEEVISLGSVGERLSSLLLQEGISAKVALANLGDSFVTHGAVAKLKESVGLHPEGLFQRCLMLLEDEALKQ